MAPLERHRELALLDVAVTDARNGRGGVVLLEGPAGIGKSVLLDEARSRARGTLTLLDARGGLLERDFGFGVVRQLLEAQARGRKLTDAARAVLADSVSDAHGPAADPGFAALHGLFWTVLDLAAERPLLLSVDDLQWADRASLRFLAYLARRVTDVPVLVLVTVRTGEGDVDEDLLSAVREHPARSLVLDPLSREGVAELLAGRVNGAPDDAFVAACHTATGGNPLLLRELAAALQAEGVEPDAARADVVRVIGPRAVSRTVATRVARLTADERAVAAAVAVLGDGVAVADVARFAGIDTERVAAATGPLARSEILRPEAPLAFVHPLVADAVALAVPAGERELQHRRAAAVLRDRGASGELIAAHLVRAPCDGEPWAVDVLRQAARTALGRGAPESATTLLRRALAEPPPTDQRAGMLLELGLVETMSSGEDAVEHLRGALAALVAPEQRVVAAAALGRTLLLLGDPAGGGAVAAAVAAELGPDHDDLRDQLVAFAQMTAWFDDRAEHLVEASAHLRTVPGPQDGVGAHMLAAVGAFAWCSLPGPREDCVRLALAALQEGRLIDADHGLIDIPAVVVLGYAEHPAGLEYLQSGLAVARRSGSVYAAAGTLLWLIALHLWRGELLEAEAFALEASDLLAGWRNDEGPDYAAAFLAHVLVERGDLRGAHAVLDGRPVTDTAAEGTRYWHEARLSLLLAERDDTAAAAAVERLATRYGHIRNPATTTWRLARAGLRHRAGDDAGANTDLDEQLSLALAWGAPGPIGRALRVRGELWGDVGDLREAVDVLHGSSMRLEYARALLALGRRLRLDRRPVDARDPLRQALALASRSGADALAEEVRAELGAAGARPRNEALSGPDALTPSERRVAFMAADGRTNRDIAQELFVTPKTVEVHLSAAYRKLGIASRKGLEEALA